VVFCRTDFLRYYTGIDRTTLWWYLADMDVRKSTTQAKHRLGLDDSDMAALFNCTRSWYNKWANGRVNSPRLDNSAKLFLLRHPEPLVDRLKRIFRTVR
jgi:hypothetical protein